jgi:hypothetical protein
MKMRLLTSSFAIGTFLISACASKSDASGDADLEAVPEQAAFALSVTDDAKDEGGATADDALDPVATDVADAMNEMTDTVTANIAPELANSRAAVRALNQALRRFMEPIVALVRNTAPTETAGNLKAWGPVTRGETEFRFVLRHGRLRRYGWLLEARAASADGAFIPVAAGSIVVGFAPRRGTGTVGIDLDALGGVDPTVTAQGQLLARFAHGALGSIVGYRVRDFVGENGSEPIDALVQGVHLKEGYNRLRLAYHGNVLETATDAPEFVLARARHQRGKGGRADLLVTGGDVAAGDVWLVSECWNAEFSAVFRAVRSCPADDLGGARCNLVKTTGDAGACPAPFAAAEFAPADPAAPMPDASSPEGDVTPPDTMPDGSPSEGP